MSTPGFAVSQPVTRERSLAIFGQVMGLVAITCAFAAAGAYIGRDLAGLWFLLPWIGAIGCLIGLNVANSKGMQQLALALLFSVGLLLGISIGYTIKYYAVTDSTAVYQAVAATALFVAALGAGGYAIRKDLSFLYRFAFFALLGLIVFGIVTLFVSMPGGSMIYAFFGLAIFGLFVVLDFNRLRRAGQQDVIPLAAGIFLTVFNIFLFFLQIFGGGNR
ncbi:MAG: Bax inhibitor-1 family protein [Solirubrobacteraceae bacterium]|jgi:FtsH-binding integral membrane protein|nr:Bax inhibitor-1 family protein [Solirubrobacteraceae bacterium]MDP4672611.1 Bax inhibitor-1 family protein [Solirubrobacteraceae bacterium]MDP4920865.1 Bax inhibitor-1 family protein [Solirubrobacteraceae bacterium]